MDIRRIKDTELDQALELVLRVFMEFEAPDYSAEGVEAFVNDVINNEGFKQGCMEGAIKMYGAFDGDKIIGVMAMRKVTHIMLAFVEKEYQGQGVGRGLFEYVIDEIRADDSSCSEITVNSSPYGAGFYRSLGFIDMFEEQEKHGIRYIPMSFRIRKYPDRDTAEEILREAEACNPGPWGNHSRTAAHCAEKIVEYSGMDSEKAYVLGLLHDIGRKFGKRHLGHVSDGYSYMMSLRYDDVARICLTHSFNEKDIEGYVGNRDTTPEETELIKTKLAEIELDDYDKLIQLCDAISGAEGVMDIIDRMTDVKNRYGNYDQSKWDTNLRLKAYFEERMGKDLYEAVEKEHFRP